MIATIAIGKGKVRSDRRCLSERNHSAKKGGEESKNEKDGFHIGIEYTVNTYK